ncbi:MAG: hypothetical protein RMJ52_19290 [Gemmataceae bacterium]|nr:hypothetical protein [Gemmataceae bacterium]
MKSDCLWCGALCALAALATGPALRVSAQQTARHRPMDGLARPANKFFHEEPNFEPRSSRSVFLGASTPYRRFDPHRHDILLLRGTVEYGLQRLD